MRHFCTYFDSHYLPRGLALYHSLVRHHKSPFTLWILCFDEMAYDILSCLQLPHIRLVKQEEFEEGDSELVSVKSQRNLLEYYWTCTPSLPLYLLEKDPSMDLITYLDADLLFFSSPEPIYQEFSDSSILLTEHRYSPVHQCLQEAAGIYNVEMMVFRRDPTGLEALRWWRKQCIDWCYRKHENGKFGDQLYLNDWPKRFPKTHVLQHPGGGVAPWNAARYHIHKQDGKVYVDDSPLIYYHYHAFALLNDWTCVSDKWGYDIPTEYFDLVYRPYLQALQESIRQIRKHFLGFEKGYETLALRDLLRFVEQRRLLVSIQPDMTEHAMRQMVRMRFPSGSSFLKEIPGVGTRFLRRSFQRISNACESSRQ